MSDGDFGVSSRIVVGHTATPAGGRQRGRALRYLVLGLSLACVGIVLLALNAARSTDVADDPAAAGVADAWPDSLDRGLDGRLVHLTGRVDTIEPVRDPDFGLTAPGLLRLRRVVEQFQRASPDAAPAWSDSVADAPLRSASFITAGGLLGAWRVDPAVLAHAESWWPFPADAASPMPAGFRASGGVLYRGRDPARPEIGDVRVSFHAVPAQVLSIVAGQEAGSIAPFARPDGTRLVVVRPGAVESGDMLPAADRPPTPPTWPLQVVGAAMLVAGLAALLRSRTIPPG